MKIRQGFVSNSSSTSFLIELNKPISKYTLKSFKRLVGNSPFAEDLYKRLLDEDYSGEITVSIYCDYANIEEYFPEDKCKELEELLILTAKKFLKKSNTYTLTYQDGYLSGMKNLLRDLYDKGNSIVKKIWR